MADRHDMTIGIGLKADLEGGVQTEKQLDKIRRKAVEVGKASGEAGNQAARSFERMQGAVGKLNAALSGLGVAGLITGLISQIKTITDSFGSAEKEAKRFGESVKAAARAKEIDDLAESYGRLTAAIAESAAANDHQNAMIAKNVAAARELEDATAQAAEQRELAAVDPAAPDAEEQRQAISARYAAAAGRRAAVRGKEDIAYRMDALNSQAVQLENSAVQKDAAAVADDEMIARLVKDRVDANRRSVSENEEDASGFLSMFASNLKRIATFQWGKVGDARTDEGNAEREKAGAEAEKIEAEIDRLKKQRDAKLKSAKADRESAKRKRDEAEIEGRRLKAADIRIGSTVESGAMSVGKADRALESRQAQIAADEELIGGADARRASIQARIDAENARLQAAADRSNKEDRDVYLAQRRLEQADAENRGKGWKRYAQGARKDLAAEVRREEEEASEARAEFKRTETSVGETVRKLLDEMRKFNADYNRATSRMNVRSDNGGASQ